MSRRARGLATAVLLGTVVAPASVTAAPEPTDGEIAESVQALDHAGAIQGIDLVASIVPLRRERTDGSTTTLRINADVLFEFGEHDLTPAARTAITAVAGRLRGATGTVRVIGHTDSLGTETENMRLSRGRAESVRAELTRAAGALRIEAIGRGEAEPVQPNTRNGEDNPEGRAENRRVEIIFQGR
ncbi:OmpA family protein [Actinomadura kijaniata]|uniref:Outer membrane protein OmpA-like peptidoglycan-associated protein n=1 Tax=Actinomadura namibiensis TaxID=182080 RepID=A0A7W3LQ29_ACTNM|nr:OmpA family protein [Actinomadura namibiensis]MBA8952194.1 outer membrane protein OmpA-like peptidoglycan-associated protein [Actinomadura namibiensis]